MVMIEIAVFILRITEFQRLDMKGHQIHPLMHQVATGPIITSSDKDLISS